MEYVRQNSAQAKTGTIPYYVQGTRIWERLQALALFGALPDGGVNRQALTPAEIQARAQMVRWARTLDLEVFTDAIANLFIRLEGERGDLPPVLIGSHLDTQPSGGKFDGAYGVIAGLEVLNAIRDSGQRPLRSIEVVAWTNEEASRFAPGMMGSQAFTGRWDLQEILAVRDAAGVPVAQAVARVLAADDDIPHRPLQRPVAACLEPHLEQGPLLEAAGIPVGIVTGIQGTLRYRVRVIGAAGHAGTVPRVARRDALMATIAMIQAVDALCEHEQDSLYTTGLLEILPNAPSVIPAETFFSIDVRQRDNAGLDRLRHAIPETLAAHAGRCAIDIREIVHAESIEFAESVREQLTRSADALDIPSMPIFSSAGHDARHLNYHCPTGMLFVPCRAGISHSPDESAAPADLEAGTKVAAHAVWQWASQ